MARETTNANDATSPPRRLGIASFPQGTLVAEWVEERGLVWTLRDYARSQVAFMRQKEWYANYLSSPPFESYSVAHGEMGYHMAAQVAAKLGAEWSPDDSQPTAETADDQSVVY